MFQRFVNLTALVLLMAATCSAFAEDDKPKTISADDAAAYAGEKVVVELTVASSRLLDDKGIVFLNSKKDYRDKENFTVVIYSETLQKFADKKISNPADHFKSKKLHVAGEIGLRRGKAQIILDSPDQIEIVKKAEKKEAA